MPPRTRWHFADSIPLLSKKDTHRMVCVFFLVIRTGIFNQGSHLLRYPIKSSGLRFSLILSTAATRSAPFICHRQRSHRSPVFALVAAICHWHIAFEIFDSRWGQKITPPNRVVLFSGDPYGNRTHVTAVKGRCLNRLTNGPGSGDLT